MGFLSKYSNYINLLKEQPDTPIDAATPVPAGEQQVGAEQPAEQQQVNVPPEGYVSLVRMIAKALVMNIQATEIDTLLSGQEITKENAFEIQNSLKKVMNDNNVKEDNPERLENPNFKKFINSVNEGNFMQKYKTLLNIMKKRSPYIT